MWRRVWSSYGVIKYSAFTEAAMVGRRRNNNFLLSLIAPLGGWESGGESTREGRTLASLLTKTISHSTTTHSSLYFSTSSDNNNKNNGNAPSSGVNNIGRVGGIGSGGGGGGGGGNENITCEEAKRIMRLVNVEALKTKLGMECKECIPYTELLSACQSMGIVRSTDEAIAFARVLDDAGVVLLFRDKVYLHPDKVVDLVKRALPLALTPEDDPMHDELKRLRERKEEIDVLAHKQVRRILWCGLGLVVAQVVLFFRLTFWEFSWDIMEPIAFFVTATSVVVGYAYFLFTARDPTYQDLLKRLFLSRQRKLFKKLKFDCERFKELQKKCRTRLDANTSIKNHAGWELELEDAIHKD